MQLEQQITGVQTQVRRQDQRDLLLVEEVQEVQEEADRRLNDRLNGLERTFNPDDE